MTRSPLNRLRSAYRRVVATGDATQAATERLEATVGDLRGQVDRLTHRLYESAGIVDDIRAVTGTRPLAAADDVLGHVTKHADRLLDAVSYTVRRQPFTGARTRVLFLVHHIEAWDSLHELVAELRTLPDFEVVVASIPRRFRGSPGPVDEDLVHAGLSARGVPHLRIDLTSDDDALEVVRALAPSIIFRQSQWDDDVADAFSTQNLSFARLCLVPYETMGIIENIPIEGVADSAVDNHYHRRAWRVFCAGEHSRAVAAAHSTRGGEQFVATGHPKADRLRSAQAAWPLERATARTPRLKVVWSAHHTISEDWTSFGMAHLVAPDMLAWARSEPDVDFVFMPHPALPPYIDDPESPVTPAEADAFVDAWNELPNATIFTGGDYAPLLAASDVMVTDGLSMLVEYQFMEHPLIYLERPGHRPFNAAGTLLLDGITRAASVEDARSYLASLTPETRAATAEAQRRSIDALFETAPAVPRIVQALREGIAAERSAEAYGSVTR